MHYKILSNLYSHIPTLQGRNQVQKRVDAGRKPLLKGAPVGPPLGPPRTPHIYFYTSLKNYIQGGPTGAPLN